MTQLPAVPQGVRPVVGEHFSHVEVPRAVREVRRVANFSSVASRRIVPRRSTLPSSPAYNKLFVVGCGRSGTSWVQNIIASHPKVITTQESHAYDIIYPTVTTRGRKNVVAWTKVLHRHDMSERSARWVGLHWWVNRSTMLGLVDWALSASGVTDADAAQSVIQGVFDSFFVERHGTESDTLLEKTPGHLHYADLILNRFPEARVVEVLRDGRDVCVSMQMQALTVSWPPTERRKQIAAWVRAARRGLALRNDPELADRVHLVRYETLKADPAGEIRRLFDFAQLDVDDAFVREVADGTDFRHNRATGAGRHTRRGEVGDWRNHFSAEDDALFRELAGDVFVEAGYTF
jgi:hypothetical protein